MTADLEAVESEADATGDGRRARRDRNREAALDAVVSLYTGGNSFPTVAQIAEQAGLSARSLFRYFADAEEICRAAVERSLQRSMELVAIAGPPPASTGERIAGFVGHRIKLYEAHAPAFRAGRAHANRLALVADSIDRFRTAMRAQALNYFADDLDRFPDEERQLVTAQVGLAGTFETLESLRRDQGLSRRATEATLVHLLTGLLQPSRQPPVAGAPPTTQGHKC